jgi:protoheme IX farnesyltransferase
MQLSTPIKVLRSSKSMGHAYLEMTKPKVILLMLLTVFVGMCLAPNAGVSWSTLILGTLGIAALSASGAVFNHILDERIDHLMQRTHRRPLPQKKISQAHALVFGVSLAVLGFLVLHQYVNSLTAWLTLLSFIGYAFVYTLYLKRATSQNIVIGGLAGAMPPLLGWTAVTNQIDPLPLVLVMIVFIWTPPHFWALALDRKDDYRQAGLPMLPVTHGDKLTKQFIFLYTILLLMVCWLPYLMRQAGLLYLLVSTAINLVFVYKAWQLYRADDLKLAMSVFKFSILHLMILFVALLGDHYGWLP